MEAKTVDVQNVPRRSSSKENSDDRRDIANETTSENQSKNRSRERQHHCLDSKRDWGDARSRKERHASSQASRRSSRENPLVTLRKKVSERRKHIDNKGPKAYEKKVESLNFDGKSNIRRVYVREHSPVPRKVSCASLKEYNSRARMGRHGKKRRLSESYRNYSSNKTRAATGFSRRSIKLTKTPKENKQREQYYDGQTKRPRYSENLSEPTEDAYAVDDGYETEYHRQLPEDWRKVYSVGDKEDSFNRSERRSYDQEWNDMDSERYDRDCLGSPQYSYEERANLPLLDDENASEISGYAEHSLQYLKKRTETQSVLPVRQFPLEKFLEVTYEQTTYKTQEDRDELAAEILGVLISSGNRQSGEELNTEISDTLRLAFVDAENLKRFLLLYADMFEVKDVDLEKEEDGVVSDCYFVTGTTNIGLCQNTSTCGDMCRCLHVCKFWLLSGKCVNQDSCHFGHSIDTPHNLDVLRMHGLHRLNDDGLRFLLKGTNNRTAGTVPRICSYYNALIGCRNVEDCPHLHICNHFVYKQCKFDHGCKRTHDLCSGQPNNLLKLYGLDSATLGESMINEILRRFNAPPRSAVSTDNRKPPFLAPSPKVVILKDHRGHAITETHDPAQGGRTGVWNWKLEGQEQIFDSISTNLEIMYQEYIRSKTRTIIANGQRMKINFEAMEAVFWGEDQEMKISRNKVPNK